MQRSNVLWYHQLHDQQLRCRRRHTIHLYIGEPHSGDPSLPPAAAADLAIGDLLNDPPAGEDLSC